MRKLIKNKIFENLDGENKRTTTSSYSKHDWFSTKEAAQYLRIPTGSLSNMVCNGTVKPRGRIGRLNRFHIDDLIELLNRK